MAANGRANLKPTQVKCLERRTSTMELRDWSIEPQVWSLKSIV